MSTKQEQSLLTLLREIRSLIDKNLKNELNISDFTMPQTMIIYNLANNEKMKISELSKKMGLTNSTVSGIVDRLEDQGVVVRERSKKDRRVVYVQFTQEHKKKYIDMHDNLDKYFDDILASIPSDQMKTIMVSLNVLREALANHQEIKTSE